MVGVDNVSDFVPERFEGLLPAMLFVCLPRQHDEAIALPIVSTVLLAGGETNLAQAQGVLEVEGI
jgi:hypothetical protein